jgi:cellulose synthase/poly-beta-1,6-N-acetylglucosamine synthase-like glycosyltransferase
LILRIALVSVAGFGHVVYPLWLWVAASGRRDPVPPSPELWPPVTFIVPAYRERNIIGSKIANLEALDYPGERQIVVVADDPETAEAARLPGVDLIEPEGRLGKPAALNRGVAAARHPVLVFTDANAMLEPGSVRALARWFADERVGAVAGEKRVEGAFGIYWAYESWLKRLETRLGSTIGLVGELGAVRREAFRALPADSPVDDLWLALDVLEHGWKIIYEPDAVASEEPNRDWREDWERRTCVVSGGLEVLQRRRRLLHPNRGRLAMQLWGHRLVRLSLGPAAHALLLLDALTRSRRSPFARVFLVLHLVASQALVRQIRGARLPRPERLAAEVLFLQLVAWGGLARYLRGDHPVMWAKRPR